ncbi:MAG: MauE/DoxX family redox-associated membrane protein [Marmoricola sp.]
MLRWVGVVARLIVGSVWVVAGVIKLPHPESSVTAVRAYQLLPLSMTSAVGHLLPMLEIVVGGCLVLGVLTRFVACVSALMQLAFIIGIASVWSRGISINCGCFGNGGVDPNAIGRYPAEIARDAGLLLLSLWLVWRSRSPYAVDNVLFPPSTTEPELQESDA